MKHGDWRWDDKCELQKELDDIWHTPEKPWDLPEYVQSFVREDGPSPSLIRVGKDRRLRRGSDRRFVVNPLVDAEAGQTGQVPKFIDDEAVSTSRSESSKASSESESCSNEGSETEEE